MISYTKIVLVHGTAATSYKMAEKQKPVSAVFKHFDLPPSTDGHFKAKCILYKGTLWYHKIHNKLVEAFGKCSVMISW